MRTPAGNFPLVVVEWEDACSYDDWHPKDNTINPLGCMTAGFLIKKSRTHLTLGRGLSGPSRSDLEGEFCIPRGCVKKIRVVRK